jgi:IS5 family transposase
MMTALSDLQDLGEAAMIVDRYPPRRLFRLVPELPQTFAPELAQLDRLLEDDAIFSRVKADMARRRPRSLGLGRPGTPVEVVLRLLVVRRLHGWSYEKVEHFVSDSLVLRQFCRVYLKKVPDDTTLLRWAQIIAPATLAALNERVVVLARQLAVTRGRKLRLDSTVVETTLHHPSDSSLLADGVRVRSRALRRARAVLGSGAASLGKTLFRTRRRSARRLVQSLHRLGRRKGEAAAEAMRQAYAKLIVVTRKTCAQATRVGTARRERPEPPAQRLARQLDTFLPRVARAIAQAVRRVLQGETVPAGEKIVSLFEPHTQIIVRHKAGKPVEFGRKLWLEEVEGGIVGGWRLLDQPGQDVAHLMPSIVAHQARFGRPPWLVTGDRGVFSPENERRAKAAGVARVVLPAAGKVAPERARIEQQRWFRRGFRFRAGIEGRISVLQRCYGLDRCPDHGEDGLGRWIGWGIITGNLERIARAVAARQPLRAA